MRADIVELRRGDHSALRLMLEQERIAAQTLDAEHKWKQNRCRTRGGVKV